MPKVTIDNQTLEYAGQPKLLQFCLDNEIELPHFCYHPAMSAPANCRQCLVEIGNPEMDRETGKPRLDEDGNPVIRFFPKLMTSCSQDMSDGMVVKTHRSSDLVRRAQKDTLEFLLLNHPLDCPICDQAGNCPLQIQAYKYGPEGSRFEFRKVSKPKHVELGPRVMLDGERCINCTRCTRFTQEVSESHQLTIIERGVKNYPMTPPGVDFDEPYSMNVIDICPVGALTSRDFRFQSRVWEMSSTPSITASNAKGSNCYYWVKDNRVLKITPRTNMDVNEYWLPDEDRTDYHRFNDDRASGPTVAGAASDWEIAYTAAGHILRDAGSEILFVGSAHASVEDNYLLGRLADAVGAQKPVYIPHVESDTGDSWLITDDKTPNAAGCELLGILPVEPSVLKSRIQSARAIFVVQEDLIGSGVCSADDLKGTPVILHHCSTTNKTVDSAAVTLPAATIVETVGTFVNLDGHAQRVRPAKAIRGVNRTLMMEIGKSRADQHGTPFDRWHNEDHMVDCQPGWVVLPEVALKLQVVFDFKGPRDVMATIVEQNNAFSGATYESMGLSGVRLVQVGMEV